VLYNASVYKNEAGEVQGVFAAARDVTERKRTEEELKKYREHLEELVNGRTAELSGTNELLKQEIAGRKKGELEYKTILQTATDGFWITDMRGRFLDINDAYCRMTGYTRDELLHMGIQDIDAVERPEETAEHIRKLMETGFDRFETRHRGKDGRIIDMEVAASFLDASGGRLIVFTRDITERKKTEEAVRELNEQLKQRNAELEAANKELEAFAHSVSHDLRAPLRTIDGFSQVIIEDYYDSLDDKGRDHLQRIRSATQRMGLLIDDMLKLSRVTRADMKREPVDLSAMVRKISFELGRSAPGRQVEFQIEPDIKVDCDPYLIQAVMENLLSNAWKFTGKNRFARIEFGGKVVEGQSVYYVKDNGVGFDMKYSDKLFSPFHRLHTMSEFPGTGVGLATVQRIVQRHGGKVWVEAEVDKGATFYFTLK
jgi:PAS domain S-box-containing protein